jgi:3'-5' exoribonuclease
MPCKGEIYSVAVEKKLFIENLSLGQEFSMPLLVKSCRRQISNRGEPYLSLELSDRSGEISAKVWEGADQLKTRLTEGSVAVVRGLVQSYRNLPQLVIRWAESVEWSDVNHRDYLPSSTRSAESMTKDLLALIARISDPDYRLLTEKVLAHPRAQEFWSTPAAKSFHHAYLGGLLEHTLSVAQMAAMVGSHYGSCLDGSLLLAGAILHDVGKIWEFSHGSVTDYTTSGRLLGHLVLGVLFITEVGQELPDFPKDKLLFIQHLIASHHGQLIHGACQTPKLLEAVALHQLDNLDGKLNGIGAFINKDIGQQVSPSPWTSYNHLLEDYFCQTPGTSRWDGSGAADDPLVQSGRSNTVPSPRLKRATDFEGQEAGESFSLRADQNVTRLF